MKQLKRVLKILASGFAVASVLTVPAYYLLRSPRFESMSKNEYKRYIAGRIVALHPDWTLAQQQRLFNEILASEPYSAIQKEKEQWTNLYPL